MAQPRRTCSLATAFFSTASTMASAPRTPTASAPLRTASSAYSTCGAWVEWVHGGQQRCCILASASALMPPATCRQMTPQQGCTHLEQVAVWGEDGDGAVVPGEWWGEQREGQAAGRWRVMTCSKLAERQAGRRRAAPPTGSLQPGLLGARRCCASDRSMPSRHMPGPWLQPWASATPCPPHSSRQERLWAPPPRIQDLPRHRTLLLPSARAGESVEKTRDDHWCFQLLRDVLEWFSNRQQRMRGARQRDRPKAIALRPHRQRRWRRQVVFAACHQCQASAWLCI